VDLEIQIEKLESENSKQKVQLLEYDDKTKEFISKLDLEAYDLCSSDFHSLKSSKKQLNKVIVPKLDMLKVAEWKEEVDRESDSQEGEDGEGEGEEDVMTANVQFLPKGDTVQSEIEMSWKESLYRRKEEVIDMLNQAYDEESKRVDSVGDSSDRSYTGANNDDFVNLRSAEREMEGKEEGKHAKKKSISNTLAIHINNLKS
jgi:hypothetical protein